jgi:hypothetical protein
MMIVSLIHLSRRTLCTTNHGVLYHHKCKRRLDDPAVARTNDAKTLRARRKENQEIRRAHEQEGCEEYCVVLECPTAPVDPSEDPRHKRAPNCVTSRRRKQAEYNYLCTWLLEVPARGEYFYLAYTFGTTDSVQASKSEKKRSTKNNASLQEARRTISLWKV